jgi:hypothetical protein
LDSLTTNLTVLTDTVSLGRVVALPDMSGLRVDRAGTSR